MKLLQPLQIGPLTLPNRVFMAPLTRLRSLEPGDVPTALMAEYYRQRASAGLIITEATQISFQAKGYSGSPGIHSAEQIAAWKHINQGIHADGGHSAVQVWHTGRVSHTSLQPGGEAPVAPSALPADARTTLRDAQGNLTRVETSAPRALSEAEIADIVADFGQAAINACEAGFDFIELHAAHGYLLHQFLTPVPTSAKTATAAALKTVRALCWRRWMRPLPTGAPTESVFACSRWVVSMVWTMAKTRKPPACT